MGPFVFVLMIALIVVAFSVVLSFIPLGLWISALAAGGVRIGILTLVGGMRFRRVPPALIVNSLIKADKAGINITTNQLEAHYLAGGKC